MGYKIKKRIKNNLIFGVHEAKKGKVIYISDNILFDLFGTITKFYLVMLYFSLRINFKT